MKIKTKLRKWLKKRRFLSNSIADKSITVGPYANCLSTKSENIQIGQNTEINGTLYSYGNGRIIIGDHCFINTSSFIGAMESVTIGSHVMISTNVRIFDNNNHPTSPSERWNMCENGFHNSNWEWKSSIHKPVVIEDNTWIGEYSVVLKGVTIGKGSIVASHSVVTRDVPPFTIVAGNPAKVVKELIEGQ